MGTAGSFFAAQGQRTAMNLDADLANMSVRRAENAARDAMEQGQREEQNLRLSTAQLKSSQRTGMAANGIDLGSQTALNILTSTDVMSEADANTIRANAVRAAFGYRTEATNEANRALMSRTSARAVSPGMAAFSSLLSGAGAVAQKWYQYDRVGALGNDTYAGPAKPKNRMIGDFPSTSTAYG